MVRFSRQSLVLSSVKRFKFLSADLLKVSIGFSNILSLTQKKKKNPSGWLYHPYYEEIQAHCVKENPSMEG